MQQENNLLSKYIPASKRNNAKQYLYADLLKVSETLRCEITREHDPVEMLKKSLVCIYALTNDICFITNNLDKLDKILRDTKENL